jgi:hypothetical protein
MRALNRAAAQIEAFHRQQLPKSWIDTRRPGTLLGQMVNPVDAAGVYVPGGKGGNTPLVSSVLMGAIPAKIAGVPKVVMATPPMPSGEVAPHLLVAAKKAGWMPSTKWAAPGPSAPWHTAHKPYPQRQRHRGARQHLRHPGQKNRRRDGGHRYDRRAQ